MVKDFKYIIKKILIGVGIAICLMYLKGGLIGQVHALSCDVDRRQNYKIIGTDWEIIMGNDQNTTGIKYTTTPANNDNVLIPFNDYDFIEIRLPMTYVYSFYVREHTIDNPNSNTWDTDTYDYESLQQPLVYLEDNTLNPNNNVWIQGVSDGSFYHFYYYKKNYSNASAISLKRVRLGLPNVPILDNRLVLWAKFNAYGQVYYHKCDSNKALEQKIEDNTQAVENINSTLEDSSTDDPASDITGMNNKIATNGSISQLLTLPITLYQSILNATVGSCSQFQLGSLFNHELVLPCINLSRVLGSTLYNIIDILLCGSFILVFRKKMVDIFNHMTSLNDRGNELE